MHGLVLTRDGSRLLATSFSDVLWEIKAGGQKLEVGRKLTLPGPGGKGDSAPCGLALSPDEKTAYVCLSRNNTLAVLDLASGKVVREIAVGVAPYDVVLFDGGSKAFVSNWGGRRARDG